MLIRVGEQAFPVQKKYNVLEVGFGDGRFTAQIAKMYPEWNILGVEIATASVWRALRRFRREDVENVDVFHGAAKFALRNFIPENSLKRIYVNFPDPWPKEKHEHNRLLQRSFFDRISTRLEDGGELWLTTDHEEYWQFSMAEGLASGLFEVTTPEIPSHHLTTKYALKWIGQGRSFYHAVFTKKIQSPVEWLPAPRFEMSHALMTGTMPEITEFEKNVVRFDGGSVVLKEMSKGTDGCYFFHAHIDEEDLIQDVLFEARPSAHGIYVGISRFGAPLNSAGVAEGTKWLAEWFAQKGLTLVQRSY